jgi:shikimate kinase
MAAGKSTIGKRLANKLNYSFVDLDTVIKISESASIEEIFQSKGEEYFRQVESKALRNFTNDENIILSTGGGTPCFHDNMEWMNRMGVTVYIEVKPEIIHYRLLQSKTKRPLIEGKTSDELLNYIAQQLKIREQYYREASIIIDGESLKLNALVDKLEEIIKEQ